MANKNICKFFTKGVCKFGESCQFAHLTSQQTSSADIGTTDICKYFQHGRCMRGDSCIYQHISSITNSVDEAKSRHSSDVSAIPTTAGEFTVPNMNGGGDERDAVCRYFQKGICSRGDSCFYAHIPVTPTSPPLALPNGDESNRRASADSTTLNNDNTVSGQPLLNDIKSSDGKLVCRYFQRGICSRGDSCFYAHIPVTPTSPPQSLPSNITNMDVDGDERYRRTSADSTTDKDLCIYFKRGKCLKGDGCSFRHTKESNADNVVSCGEKVFLAGFRDLVKSKALELTVSVKWPDIYEAENSSADWSIQLFGSELGVAELKNFINSVVRDKVKSRDWEVSQKGLHRLFTNNEGGMHWVNTVLKKKHDCVINVERIPLLVNSDSTVKMAKVKIKMSKDLSIHQCSDEILNIKGDVLLLPAPNFTIPTQLLQLVDNTLQDERDTSSPKTIDGVGRVKVVRCHNQIPYSQLILFDPHSIPDTDQGVVLRGLISWILSFLHDSNLHSLYMVPLMLDSNEFGVLSPDIYCQSLVGEAQKYTEKHSDDVKVTNISVISADPTIVDEMTTWRDIMSPDEDAECDDGNVLVDRIIFHFLAMDSGNINSSIEDLKVYISKHLIKREFNNAAISRDTVLPKTLHEFEEKYHISLKVIDSSHLIICEGFLEDVVRFGLAFTKFLTKLSYAKIQTEKEVLWMFMGSNGWERFPIMASYEIEDNYTMKKTRIIVNNEECGVYSVNFKSMEARLMGSSRDVEVQRVSLVVGNHPSYWSMMQEEESLKLVALRPDDVEYKRQLSAFLQSAHTKVSVEKIERIQNPRLYTQYCVQLEHVKMRLDKNNATTPNTIERTLYHGTSHDSIHSINTGGFNRSFAGRNATVYGKGTYFAVESNYSLTSYCPLSSKGLRYVYACSVVTGEYTNGTSTMSYPPFIDSTQNVRYDSLVDNANNPKIYIIFNDNAAYPAYLITFK